MFLERRNEMRDKVDEIWLKMRDKMVDERYG